MRKHAMHVSIKRKPAVNVIALSAPSINFSSQPECIANLQIFKASKHEFMLRTGLPASVPPSPPPSLLPSLLHCLPLFFPRRSLLLSASSADTSFISHPDVPD